MKIKSKKYCSEQYFSQLTELYDWFVNSHQALQVYTSGSTGKPQLIEHSKEAVLASAKASVEYFDLDANSKILLGIPLDKIGGIMLAIRAFIAEAEILPVDPQKNLFTDIPGDWTFDFCSMVPNQVAACEQHWHRLGIILIGGGPIDQGLQDLVYKKQGVSSFYQSYASTETISHVAVRKLSPELDSDYQALPGVSFSTNSTQALIIDAPHIGVKELVTKDQVELYSDRSFRWLGRLDNVVLSGGLKLYPEEIEGKINWPFPFFLSGREDQVLSEKLVLVMQEKDFNPLLITLINEMVSGPEKPKSFILIEEMLYTSTGKIKRQESLLKIKREISVN